MAIGDQTDLLSRLVGVMPGGWFENTGNPITDQNGHPITDENGHDITDGTPGPPVITALLLAFGNLQAFIYSLLAYIKLQTRIATATGGFLDLIAFDFFGLTIQRASGQTDASFRQTILAALFLQRNTRAAVIMSLTTLTGRAPLVFNGWRDTAYLNQNAYYGRSRWGSRGTPYQSFVIAYRGNGVSDAQIYAAVAAVQSAGITLWTQIQN